MTINGAKKALEKEDFLKLDEKFNHSIKLNNLKVKIENLSKLIKNLKE